jgi:DNA-binding HxlR family transcriptional regulator
MTAPMPAEKPKDYPQDHESARVLGGRLGRLAALGEARREEDARVGMRVLYALLDNPDDPQIIAFSRRLAERVTDAQTEGVTNG